MEAPTRQTVTQLLDAAKHGDGQALSDLLPMVYTELRSLADSWMRNLGPGQTLQPTALVHEAFVRLVGKQLDEFENREHFFFAAGRAMRDILVENARRKLRDKRGGNRRRVDLSNLTVAAEAPPEDLLGLEEALTRLEAEHSRSFQVVLLRFYVGLTELQVAELTGVSLRTVEREWRFVRAWLHKELRPDDTDSD